MVLLPPFTPQNIDKLIPKARTAPPFAVTDAPSNTAAPATPVFMRSACGSRFSRRSVSRPLMAQA